MPNPARLSFTRLEDRTVPALFGVTWPDPQNLTVSFAKDGTDVGGVASSLQSYLGGVASADTWQGEIRRALQTWAAVTNIDVHVVADDGAAFGKDAAPQGSPLRGDIRLAARPLATAALAVANPPDMVSGWAGEIVLNTNYKFSVGGANGTYDLYSVVLHEAGHALGVSSDYALDKSAVMHETYSGTRTGLSAADVAAIQELYGVRAADAYEGNKGNGTTSTATAINYLTSLTQTDSNYIGGGAIANVVRAGLTTATDVDIYKIQLPTITAFTFPRLQLTTSLVSQLAAKVSVLDDTGKVVLTATADGPGKDISLDLKTLPGGKTYYVRVEAASPTVFGVGDYRLAVGGSLMVSLASAFTSEFSTSGETLETDGAFTGILFGKVLDKADARWDATGRSQLSSASQTHYFELTAKADAAAMVVAMWTSGDISPKLRVTDSNGKDVPFEVLRADSYATLIQVLGVQANTTYRVTLSSGNWKQSLWAGPVKYRMAADFRAEPITLAKFADGTLTATNPMAARNFTVTQSQLFRFELTANSLLTQAGATATLTVTDSTGKVVYTLTTGAGQTLAGDVFLTAGSYSVKITASTTSGSLLPLSVVARIAPLTDPIGPTLLDPTAPLDAPVTTTGTTTTAKTTETTVAPPTDTCNLGFFWGVALIDPLKIWW